ncbi:MAG: hypothetical protein R2941_22930 [Desulfobacterales bacterium]
MYTYPVYKYQTASPTLPSSRYVLNAGILGTIVGGSAALGVNLHKVRKKEMTVEQAVSNSIAKGAGAGVATAVGAAAASAVSGGLLSVAVMAAAASSVVYLLNSGGKSGSEKVKSAATEEAKQEEPKND